ncbi:MAG: GAF domain-containing protein [Geodermatophilaceae bacterium]|nr:GAF domain-containing protein [Geodermatophilaceae bacterium]
MRLEGIRKSSERLRAEWMTALAFLSLAGYFALALVLSPGVRSSVGPLTLIPACLASWIGLRRGLAIVSAIFVFSALTVEPSRSFTSEPLLGLATLLLAASVTGYCGAAHRRLRTAAHTIQALREKDAIRASTLAGALERVGAADDLEAALSALLDGASLLLGSRHGMARVVVPGTRQIDVQVKRMPDGTINVVCQEPMQANSFGERILKDGLPILVNDYQQMSISDYPQRDGVLRDGARSALHVAIAAGGVPIGNLSLNHQEPGFFDASAVALAGALASRAGAAIERTRLATARRAAELERAQLDGALLVARTTAHEINNALHPIAGYAELLTMLPTIKADPVASKYARAIHAGAEIAAGKVRQLSQIARLSRSDLVQSPTGPMLDLNLSSNALPAVDGASPAPAAVAAP